MLRIFYPVLVFIFFIFTSCSKDYVPKPKGYNRLDLPQPSYRELEERFPYTFEYSRYSVIKKDNSSIAEPYWINVYYPSFDADIQLTYKPLFSKIDHKRLEELIDDSYKLANKHQVKAYSIEENIIKTPSGKSAVVIELTGDVPSPFQFYLTDSSENFMRGAVYFKSTKIDSLSPSIEYMKKEVMHLINTFEWRKAKK
ncbi:MAG: gliding motility lipoprotein GldD [Opitutaceae bacterium]|nr:gliding motility lipoprotein GldD [Cytophagales bacterium]